MRICAELVDTFFYHRLNRGHRVVFRISCSHVQTSPMPNDEHWKRRFCRGESAENAYVDTRATISPPTQNTLRPAALSSPSEGQCLRDPSLLAKGPGDGVCRSQCKQGRATGSPVRTLWLGGRAKVRLERVDTARRHCPTVVPTIRAAAPTRDNRIDAHNTLECAYPINQIKGDRHHANTSRSN